MLFYLLLLTRTRTLKTVFQKLTEDFLLPEFLLLSCLDGEPLLHLPPLLLQLLKDAARVAVVPVSRHQGRDQSVRLALSCKEKNELSY